MFEKIEVLCLICDKTRFINKSSYKSDLNVEPYIQTCGGCGRSGRILSEDHINKIKEALTGRKLSTETKQKISEYRKAHPELWVTLQPELGRLSRKENKKDQS